MNKLINVINFFAHWRHIRVGTLILGVLCLCTRVPFSFSRSVLTPGDRLPYFYNATIHHTHTRGTYCHRSLLWNGNALEWPCKNAITLGSSACQNLPPSSILKIPRSDIPQISKSSSIFDLGAGHWKWVMQLDFFCRVPLVPPLLSLFGAGACSWYTT